MKENSRLHACAELSLCLAGAVLAFWLVMRYLAGIFLPFLVGWGLAFLARPIACRIHRGTRIPTRFLRLATVLGALLLLSGGVWALSARLAKEAGALLSRLTDGGFPDAGELLGRLPPRVAEIVGALPFFQVEGDTPSLLGELLRSLMETLTGVLPSLLGSLVSSVPKMVLTFVVTLISAVYFCLDLETVNQAILSLCPSTQRARLLSFKNGMARTALLYLRSYLILMGMTTAILLVGFLFMGVEYALLLAFVISLVDILPVLGVGTVLLPWAVGAFLVGNTPRGVALILLYLVAVTVRQLAEPKILGGSLGVHPLFALLFTYGGFRLGGVWGMILGPAVGVLLLALLRAKTNVPSAPSSTA